MTPEELIEAVSKMTPGEWTGMDRPPPSRVDHGWRAVAFIGQRLMVAVPADVMFEHSGPGTSAKNAAGISALKNHAVRIVQSLISERDAALARVAELETDAARYKWLRDMSCHVGFNASEWAHRPEQIDAAIAHTNTAYMPVDPNTRDAGPSPFSGRTTRRDEG